MKELCGAATGEDQVEYQEKVLYRESGQALEHPGKWAQPAEFKKLLDSAPRPMALIFWVVLWVVPVEPGVGLNDHYRFLVTCDSL